MYAWLEDWEEGRPIVTWAVRRPTPRAKVIASPPGRRVWIAVRRGTVNMADYNLIDYIGPPRSLLKQWQVDAIVEAVQRYGGPDPGPAGMAPYDEGVWLVTIGANHPY